MATVVTDRQQTTTRLNQKAKAKGSYYRVELRYCTGTLCTAEEFA